MTGRRNHQDIFTFTNWWFDTGCLLEPQLVCQLEYLCSLSLWSLCMRWLGLPPNIVTFFFGRTIANLLLSIQCHIIAPPSAQSPHLPIPHLPPGYAKVKRKKKKRTLDFCSSSGGRGLGPGSLFAQVAAGRKADPSMPRDWGFRLQQEREFATRSRNRACVCGRGVAGRVPRELVGSAWYFYALVFGSYSVTSAVCFSWSKYKVLPNFKMKNIDHSIW